MERGAVRIDIMILRESGLSSLSYRVVSGG
jgi:hypothetical protein